MFQVTNKKGIKFFVGVLLVFVVFFGSFKKTEAVGAVVYDPVNWVENAASAVSNAASAAVDALMEEKEYILDTLAWTVAKAAVSEIVQATTNWVNSGFNGNPLYVSDFGSFMTDVGDQVFSNYITGTKLDFLCSPFSADIKLALSYGFDDDEPECRLSEVVENMDTAFEDLSEQWDWDTFFVMTSDMQSNPFGAYMSASVRINADLTNQQQQWADQLNWGSGFLSQQKCDVVDEKTGKKTCRTVTPGTTLSASINKGLGAGTDSLVAADEIDELIGALLSQLMMSVMSEDGLAGMTDEKMSEISEEDYDGRLDEMYEAYDEMVSLRSSIFYFSKTLVQDQILTGVDEIIANCSTRNPELTEWAEGIKDEYTYPNDGVATDVQVFADRMVGMRDTLKCIGGECESAGYIPEIEGFYSDDDLSSEEQDLFDEYYSDFQDMKTEEGWPSTSKQSWIESETDTAEGILDQVEDGKDCSVSWSTEETDEGSGSDEENGGSSGGGSSSGGGGSSDLVCSSDAGKDAFSDCLDNCTSTYGSKSVSTALCVSECNNDDGSCEDVDVNDYK